MPTPPANVRPIPLRSVVMPAPPTYAEYVAGTAAWVPTSVSTVDWGWLQVVINDVDVTTFRGVPCVIESFGNQEPFGDDLAVVDFPQILQFEKLGAGDLDWCFNFAKAEIYVVYDDTTTKCLFGGYVQITGDGYASQTGSGTTTTNGGGSMLQLTLQGTMYQSALTIIPPYYQGTTLTGLQDAGLLISNALSKVTNYRWGPCLEVSTGIKLAPSPGFTSVMEYVQDLLSQMMTVGDDSAYWTINCPAGAFATPVIGTKNVAGNTLAHTVPASLWTVDAGAPGVDTSGLINDGTLNTTTVYGSGTSGGEVIDYSTPTLVVPTNSDPGGQSFMNTTYSDGVPVVNPLYIEPGLGDEAIHVEVYNAYGTGISLATAIALAEAEVNRDYQASWAGTIVLTTDPHEGSRFEIRAGDNINLNYFHGIASTTATAPAVINYSGIIFHVNAVSVSIDSAPSMSTGVPSSSPSLSVSLSVDTAARDATTSASMLTHALGSARDLVRRPQPLKRSSRMTEDTVAQFDYSAGAGVIWPAHVIPEATWTTFQVPFGQLGLVAKTTFNCDAYGVLVDGEPVGLPFYVAIFNTVDIDGLPVDPQGLLTATVPDPTVLNIWQKTASYLKNPLGGGSTPGQGGIVVGWGGNTGGGLSPCGYWPSTLPIQVANSGDLDATGDFIDDDSWTYTTGRAYPFLWVCVFSPEGEASFSGRFEQAPGGTPA